MSGMERRPDNGVPSVCDSAAEQVRGICTDLAGAASTASSLAPTVRTAWQGQAGNAFCSSLDAATESSRLTVAAWDRVKDELVRYATRLRDIQARGDQIRSELSSAEGSLSTAKKTLARYEKDDDTAAWRITHARGTIASLTDDIATQIVALDNLRAERQALDNDVAAALHSAPGAGATAWQAIAYRNGRTVPKTDILDELLDLLDRDPTGNLDLLHQFLLMHSNDAELMGTFYDAIGASGLLDLMRKADLMAGVGGNRVSPLLAEGLATASQGWSTRQQERFGAQLINAIKADLPALGTPYDSTRVYALLSAPGLAPHVGFGAFKRLDSLRLEDPRLFSRITCASDLSTSADFEQSGSLCNTIFMLLAKIPSATRDYLLSPGCSQDAISYWYGAHPWAGDGFEGPAALLHAITTDPALRPHDPTDTAWNGALDFLGRAVSALAGNSDLSIAAISPAASLHIAGSLAQVIPEIAGLLIGKNVLDPDIGLVTEVLIDGTLATIMALRIDAGPLAHVLGVVLQEASALELFGADLGRYLEAAHTYATSALDYDDASRVWMGTGVLYGFTHGALGHQFELAARASADDIESAARALDRFLSLIPIPSTGKVVVDLLAEGAVGSIPDIMIAASDASSHEEIKQLVIDHRNDGKERLIGSWVNVIAETPITNITEENLRNSINHWYDVFGNAAGNPNPSGSFGLTPADQPGACKEETTR